MAEDKVSMVFNQIEGESDPFNQDAIRAILTTRVAAGLELKEKHHKRFKMGVVWGATDALLEGLYEKDPSRAYELAVSLIMGEESSNPRKRLVDKWVKTSGLSILGFDESGGWLEEYLENGERGYELAQRLEAYLRADLKEITTKSHFRKPKTFSAVQTAHVVLGLEDAENDVARGLFNLARELLDEKDSHLLRVSKMFRKDGYEYLDRTIFANADETKARG